MRAARETPSNRLKIGVVGHRVLKDPDRIRAGIDRTLKHLEAVFHARSWTVLSSLAEGADRLVVERILARTPARLVAPLPLAVGTYVRDFTSAESRAAFRRLLARARIVRMPRGATRSIAYQRAGDWLVDHSHVLVAVWDGRRTHRAAGTAAAVARARSRGLPIAWVRAGTGRVVYENF